MEVRNKSKTIPDWAQSFLSTFYPTEVMEREAAVNVKTLPKVVWNDNTFYVSLDAEEGNADVLNEYGNVVTALKEVNSLQDVEQRLNKQIIAEVTDTSYKKSNKQKKIIKLDDELEKVADTLTQLEKTADDQSLSMQTTDPSINKSVDTVTNTPSNTTSDITNQQMDTANQSDGNQQMTNTAIKKLQNQLKITQSALKNDQVKINKLLQKIDHYENKTAKMNNTIVKLASTVKALQDQIHAYMNPGNVYDLNCQEREMSHYNQTAKDSAQAIAAEHKVDLTTPYGRSSLKDKILQEIDSIKMPEEILTESVEVSPIESQVNDVAEETPIEQELPQKTVTIINTNDVVGSDIDNDIDDDDVEIISDNDEDEKTRMPLNEDESSVFKERICPVCNQQSLSLHKKKASIQDILCHNCNTKFGVNLNNEKIFKYY